MSRTTGISITKGVSFRGVTQEFSNVYHYKTPIGTATESEADSLIDTIVAREKLLHGTDVTFIRAKAWSDGGTNAENQMIKQKLLSGTGTLAASSSLDRERAVLIQFAAGVDSRNRPVKLRKWFHICGGYLGPTAISAAELQNTAQISSTVRGLYETSVNNLKSITAGVRGFDLCGPNGRDTTGDAVCHKYLEHHQLGDMWR